MADELSFSGSTDLLSCIHTRLAAPVLLVAAAADFLFSVAPVTSGGAAGHQLNDPDVARLAPSSGFFSSLQLLGRTQSTEKRRNFCRGPLRNGKTSGEVLRVDKCPRQPTRRLIQPHERTNRSWMLHWNV